MSTWTLIPRWSAWHLSRWTLLSSGSGLVIYVILMLIVPERPADKRKLKSKRDVAEWPDQQPPDDAPPPDTPADHRPD